MDWQITPDDSVVALTDAGHKTRADLCRDSAALAQSLARQPYQDWLWWETDSYRFLCGALAVLSSGRRLLLPPNTTAATLQTLHGKDVGLLADIFPPHSSANNSAAFADDTVAAPALLLPDTASLLLFTSGSTAAPKCIARTLGQLRQEVDTLESVFAARVGPVVIASVSQQHIYGLLFKLLWPLCSGRAFLNQTCEFPEALAAALQKYPDATVISSPAMLRRWPAELALSADTIFSSGGPLAAEARQQLPCPDDAVIEVLGSSETGGMAWRTQSSKPWQAFPDVQWQIDAQGLLQVQSPHAYASGWLYSGDTASACGSGFLLGSRHDRVVKLEEKRISLDAVEAALREHSDISDAHVLLLAGSHRQEIAAVLVLNARGQEKQLQQGPAFIRELRQSLRHSLEALALPRRWRFVPTLPLNSQGKLDRLSMMALFENSPSMPTTISGSANTPAPPTMPELLALDIQGDVLTINARVPADLCYLQGHFPQAAVVAGVAQIAWVEALGREHLGLQGRFSKMEQLKFPQLLRPEMNFHMQIDYQRSKSRLVFRLFSEAHTFSSGRLVYLQEDAQ